MKRSILVLALALGIGFSASHVSAAALGLMFTNHQIVDRLSFAPWGDSALSIRPNAADSKLDISLEPSGDKHEARLNFFYDDPLGPGTNGAWRNGILETGGPPGGEGLYLLTETTDSTKAPPLPIRIGSSDFAQGSIREILAIVPDPTGGTVGGVKLGPAGAYLDLTAKQLRGVAQVQNINGLCGTGARVNWCMPLGQTGTGAVTGYLPIYDAP